MSTFQTGDNPERGDWWKHGKSQPDWSPSTDQPRPEEITDHGGEEWKNGPAKDWDPNDE